MTLKLSPFDVGDLRGMGTILLPGIAIAIAQVRRHGPAGAVGRLPESAASLRRGNKATPA